MVITCFNSSTCFVSHGFNISMLHDTLSDEPCRSPAHALSQQKSTVPILFMTWAILPPSKCTYATAQNCTSTVSVSDGERNTRRLCRRGRSRSTTSHVPSGRHLRTGSKGKFIPNKLELPFRARSRCRNGFEYPIRAFL